MKLWASTSNRSSRMIQLLPIQRLTDMWPDWEPPDFASAVATYGLEINLADSASDQRYSIRYQHNLKEPLKSILAVPIIYENQIIGVVEVYNKSSAGELVAEGFSPGRSGDSARTFRTHIGIAMTKLNLIQYDAHDRLAAS